MQTSVHLYWTMLHGCAHSVRFLGFGKHPYREMKTVNQCVTARTVSEMQLLGCENNRRQAAKERPTTLIFSLANEKVSRYLALTSPLSDSAIFLLRSMQRDECLIPISARKNCAHT